MNTYTYSKNDSVKALVFFSNKMDFSTGPIELSRAIDQKQDFVVVDVRGAEDFKAGHLRGAVSLPHGTWDNPVGLRKDKLNVLYCYSHVCHLAAAAAVELARQGFPVMEMDGGSLAAHRTMSRQATAPGHKVVLKARRCCRHFNHNLTIP